MPSAPRKCLNGPIRLRRGRTMSVIEREVANLRVLVKKALALARSGDEFPDRIKNKLGFWLNYGTPRCSLAEVRPEGGLWDAIRIILDSHEWEHASEIPSSIERHLEAGKQILEEVEAPFGTYHHGTLTLGRICYALCRALRPQVVIETGVAYGVTSAYILQALRENGIGVLHSIDMPPLIAESRNFVGYLVPSELRSRWDLRIGSSRKLLPRVIAEVGPIDVFIHDSLHTYAHMRWEFEVAIRALRGGAVLVADDIEGNRAFEEMLSNSRIASSFAMKQEGKTALCGAARMRDR